MKAPKKKFLIFPKARTKSWKVCSLSCFVSRPNLLQIVSDNLEIFGTSFQYHLQLLKISKIYFAYVTSCTLMIHFIPLASLVSFYSSLFFPSSDDSRVMSIINIMEEKRESQFLVFDKSDVISLSLNEYDLMRALQ